MSAAKRTPGPWAWQRMGEWCLVGQQGMRPIVLTADRNLRGLTSLMDGMLCPLDPAHPDAMLIASAPEKQAKIDALADALEELLIAYRFTAEHRQADVDVAVAALCAAGRLP